jgi:hypothetical protein
MKKKKNKTIKFKKIKKKGETTQTYVVSHLFRDDLQREKRGGGNRTTYFAQRIGVRSVVRAPGPQRAVRALGFGIGVGVHRSGLRLQIGAAVCAGGAVHRPCNCGCKWMEGEGSEPPNPITHTHTYTQHKIESRLTL